MPKFSRKRGVGKQAAGKKAYRKSLKTANRSKDIDQIQDELVALKNPTKKLPFYEKVRDLPVDADLPGSGQYYCRYCAVYFISNDVLLTHERTKIHKKRVKVVHSEPYSQADADAAAGMGRTQKTLGS